MKKLYSVFFLLSLILSGCEQEEFTGTGLEALADFQLVTGSETVELRSIYPENELIIEWSEAESGLESEVLYTWLAYDDNSSVEEPLVAIPSNNEGRENSLTVTFEALDNTLEGLGLATGETVTLNWTVLADNGDIVKVADPNAITLTRFKDEIAPFGLISVPNETSVDLQIDNPGAEILITWDSTYSGFGNTVSYTWEAIKPDGDFSEPFLSLPSDNEGLDNSLTLTHQTVDQILETEGLAEGETLTLQWQVVASSGSLSQGSDDVFTISFKRFTSVQAKYLVGAATPGGWGWDNPTEIVEVEEGLFQGTLVFNNEAFRVFDVRDDWGSGTNFPGFLDQGYTIDDRFENAADGDQNFRFVGEAGEYTFTLDTNNKLIYIDGRPSKFMVGAATPSGWDWDEPTVEMIQIKENVWVSVLNFENDAFRFFETEGDWGSGRNYPYYENEGYTIDASFENALDGDSNFRFIGTPGIYKITLDAVNKSIILE
ncbi:SusE domain-containing protein [Marivirga sp. S37H4]|uniref:SusE domain-containing protein n=1 Tax=Marivirga aurantiaca TaxID=2802615 RepID=A0A934X2H9_9BACT|nr:SusE domain-containing protein [Marivirga aurantiaca]MBK6267276.1 SusE domain-containing protein [Marivirga aurantiaca]